MKHTLAFLVVSACGFRGAGEHDASVASDTTVRVDDQRIDTSESTATCPADPHLRLCYSLDQATLPMTLPNEGVVAVDAQLTNVTRIDRGTGGAAELGTSSQIFVPMAPVTGILALDLWFRVDTDPADGGRYGIVDSNVIPPNISLFVMRQGRTHQLRCGIGNALHVWPVTLAIDSWVHVVCQCEGPNLTLYVDGTQVATEPGDQCASGGAFVADGFAIGANNYGGPTGIDDRFIGAIDDLRLWDTPLGSDAIAQSAGR